MNGGMCKCTWMAWKTKVDLGLVGGGGRGK